MAMAAMVQWLCCLVLLIGAALAQQPVPVPVPQSPPVQMCDSQIYCQGRILQTVAYFKTINPDRFCNDSKEFVDRPLKNAPDAVLADFNARFPDTQPITDIDEDEFAAFLDDNFKFNTCQQPALPGWELDNCSPDDWTPAPPRLMTIQDDNCRQFALDVHQKWKSLCRQAIADVKTNPSMYSLLYVPNPYIAPGGRFREYYYWDTFWIMKGLLASGMHQTIRHQINNLASLVEDASLGFVPNGGRVYYTQRSQPPFLIAMVLVYYQDTGDADFVRQIFPTLEKELSFWQNRRSVNVPAAGTFYQYRTPTQVPRPESYKEDVAVAKDYDQSRQRVIYQNIASIAESGYDFSSRWRRPWDGTQVDNDILNIIPVDLNAIICYNLRILAFFSQVIGDSGKSEKYLDERYAFGQAFNRLFYNDTLDAWFDYDLNTNSQHTRFNLGQAVPLFADCYDSLDRPKQREVFNYMQSSGAFGYPSGVPTSMYQSGEQWDFPNGWAPLNHMLVEGLRKADDPQLQMSFMQEAAFELASKWVLANQEAFYNSMSGSANGGTCSDGCMFEKMDVTSADPGAGGEYPTQIGFGWTNGATLDFLVTYADRLQCPPLQSGASHALVHRLVPVLLGALAALLVLNMGRIG